MSIVILLAVTTAVSCVLAILLLGAGILLEFYGDRVKSGIVTRVALAFALLALAAIFTLAVLLFGTFPVENPQ